MRKEYIQGLTACRRADLVRNVAYRSALRQTTTLKQSADSRVGREGDWIVPALDVVTLLPDHLVPCCALHQPALTRNKPGAASYQTIPCTTFYCCAQTARGQRHAAKCGEPRAPKYHWLFGAHFIHQQHDSLISFRNT